MKIKSKKFLATYCIATVFLSFAVFVFAFFPLGLGYWATAVTLAFAVIFFWYTTRRYFSRRRVAKKEFPEKWREHLRKCVGFYRKLDDDGKKRFERDMLIFLAEQRIYGIQGAEVPDEMKVLIAASAAMLGFGIPDWEWPTVRDIVVYPSTFNKEYETGGNKNIAGMVHYQGPILFSGPELRTGFCAEKDGYNVGLHELAHVLDMADGSADGIPAGAEWVAKAPWFEIVADRLTKTRQGKMRKVIRNYGGKNKAEFFAVAVEAFYEKPEKLAERDPEVFEMLAEYFNVDPRTGELLKPID